MFSNINLLVYVHGYGCGYAHGSDVYMYCGTFLFYKIYGFRKDIKPLLPPIGLSDYLTKSNM